MRGSYVNFGEKGRPATDGVRGKIKEEIPSEERVNWRKRRRRRRERRFAIKVE